MTIRKLREVKNIYNALCIVDVIVMIIVAAFRPLHMIASSEMYSTQDKIGLALCIGFITMVMVLEHHHRAYSVAEYRYRVAIHHKKQRKKAQEQQ